MFLAQNVNLQNIIALLGPSQDRLVFDIMLYIMFFLALITMFMQSEKTMLPTLIMASVMLMTVLAKLRVLDNVRVLVDNVGLGALMINIGMFVLPWIVAGMTKNPKSRPFAILGGIIGLAHMFLFWATFQRG